MRQVFFLHAILLSCVAAASETVTAFRQDVAQELERITRLEHEGRLIEAERDLLKLIRNTADGSLEQSTSLNNLGVLYAATDRYPDAERAFRQAIRAGEALSGEVPEQLLAKTKLHLAALYVEMERASEAMKLQVHLLADILRSPEDKARVKGTLAGLAMIRNDLDAADRIYNDELSYWREPSRVERSGTEIATLLNNLGVVALRQRRLDLARQRFEESLEIGERVFGFRHPTLIRLLGNLGDICRRLKQYDAAVAYFERSISMARQTFGESHSQVVTLQFAYADALKKAGRKPEASQVERVASEARKTMRNPPTLGYTVDHRDLAGMK